MPGHDNPYGFDPAHPYDDIDDAAPVAELRRAPRPGLLERFDINLEAGYRYNTLSGAGRDMARPDARRRFDARYEAFPGYEGLLEGSVALLGQLAGTAASVENYIPLGIGARLFGLGAKTGMAAVRARVFAGAVDAGVTNLAIDSAIQGGEVASGLRRRFSVEQLAASAALGGIAGGVAGGVAGALARRRAVRAGSGKPERSPAPAGAEAIGDVLDRRAGMRRPVDGAGTGGGAAAEPPARRARPPHGGEDLPVRAKDAPAAAGEGVRPGGKGGSADAAGNAMRGARGPLHAAMDDFSGAPARVKEGVKTPDGAGGASPAFVRLRDVANDLARRLGVPAVRQGRMTGRKSGLLGQYSPSSGVVRVRHIDDFDTLTHEAGHHMEVALGEPLVALMRRHRGELKAMAYPGAAKRAVLKEGYAEYMRLFLTNPGYAERHAPGFDAAFRDLLAREHAGLAAIMDEVRVAYGQWLDQPSQAAVASTIVSTRRPSRPATLRAALDRHGVTGTVADVLGRAYTFLFDDLHPVQQAVRGLAKIYRHNTGRKLDIKVRDDAYKLARMSRGAHAAGHADLMYGVHGYGETVPSSPSLRDAILKATGAANGLSHWDEGKVAAFGAYLWSRRALGEWDRYRAGDIPNPPDKLTRGDHEVNIRELEAANPPFAEAARDVHEWARALWRKKYRAGLISADQYAQGLKIRDYVPGLRDFSDDAPAAPAGRSGSRKSGFVQHFRGSTRDVINPLESLMADAYETAMAIARNDVIRALDRLARQAGNGAGAIAERIPARELKATMVDPVEAFESAARASGLDPRDMAAIRDAAEAAIGDERAAIFRPAVINERGEPIVFFRDGGELRALRLADGRFGRDMYAALTNMSRGEQHLLTSMLSVPAAGLRAGITTSPDFLVANFIRDQVLASIFYGHPFKRLGATLSGVMDEILNRDAARAYNAAAGLMGGANVASLRTGMVRRDLAALRKKGYLASRLTSFRGLMEVTELSETGMRIGLFRTFFDEARTRGLDDLEATLEASWRARDHIDFDRRGSGLAAMARVVPFFNASLQGLDKGVRHMIAPLARKRFGRMLTAEDDRAMGQALKSWAYLAVALVGTVSLHALGSRHDEYAEISGYTRATHWMVRFGSEWLAIPKPFEAAAVLNMGEAVWDAWVLNDPTAASRYLDGLFDVLAPPNPVTSNPSVRAYFEVATNYNLFFDRPIVPEYLRGLEPWLQYTHASSMLSRFLGERISVSPAIIDHLITAHAGSWGRGLLSLYDWTSGEKPAPGLADFFVTRRFIKSAARGSTSSRAFWDLVGRQAGAFEAAASSWRTMMDSGDEAGAADYLARLDGDTRAYITARMMGARVHRLHPLRRARDAVRAIGALRRQVIDGRIDGRAGPVDMDRRARRAADDILADMAMAEARNALVLLARPGWKMRAMIPVDSYYRELAALSPQLAVVLADRLATAKVLPFGRIQALWPALRERLLRYGGQAETDDLVTRAGRDYEYGGRRSKRRPAPQVPAG